jgi:hypothetical protein
MFEHLRPREGAAGSVHWVILGSPTLCFPAALEALEIQAIRSAAYPVVMAHEPALQGQPTQPQKHLRQLGPRCSGASRQNGCLQ